MFLFTRGSLFEFILSFRVVLGSCVSDVMTANQGSRLTSSNIFGKTQYKSRKDLWVIRCLGISCWIGRGDIVSHLLGI